MKTDLTSSVFLLLIPPAFNVSAFLFSATLIAGRIFCGNEIHYLSNI